MNLIATYDHYRSFSGHAGEQELVLRGQEFPVKATGQASREEMARQIIRQGVGMTAEAWAKHGPRTEKNWQAAKAIASAADAERDRARIEKERARQKAAEEEAERQNLARLSDV